jgi:hypothetical protein
MSESGKAKCQRGSEMWTITMPIYEALNGERRCQHAQSNVEKHNVHMQSDWKRCQHAKSKVEKQGARMQSE